MTCGQALFWASNRLKSSSPSPELDAELLLSYTFGWPRTVLLAQTSRRLNFWREYKFKKFISKRLRGCPVAYLIGVKEFYGREFIVNHLTLIPRPESEILLEEAIQVIRANNNLKTTIDIGTGSGCLAISLALSLPGLKIIATDISKKTLRTAKQNAKLHNTIGNIEFLQGNLLAPVSKKGLINANSLIIANLPYLKTNEIKGDLLFEPYWALDGGSDGMKFYKTLFLQIKSLDHKYRPRLILLEIHPPTVLSLKALIAKYLPSSQLEIMADLSGRPRLAKIILN